jgi:hypothetical protein
MDLQTKTHAVEPDNCDASAADEQRRLSPDLDEEEREFVGEMLKMSRRNTAREIERLYRPKR